MTDFIIENVVDENGKNRQAESTEKLVYRQAH